jgi:hypothetical protein
MKIKSKLPQTLADWLRHFDRIREIRVRRLLAGKYGDISVQFKP